jgi:anti-sigma factor RsiW
MGSLIHLHLDRHDEALKLLPWYATGRLDPADHAQVAAHLVDCGECRAELASERRLHAGVAGLVIDVEMGWAAFRRAYAARPRHRLAGVARAGLRHMTSRPAALGLLVAAQALLLLVAAPIISPPGRPAPYRTLGANAPVATGNIVVMFRPETSERALRRALTLSGARLVDGPTAANAYVLRVPGAGRIAALAILHAQPAVMLAEPIDPGS